MTVSSGYEFAINITYKTSYGKITVNLANTLTPTLSMNYSLFAP